MRTNVRISRARIATGRGNGSKNASFEIRKASRARAPDSLSSSEGRTPERLDKTKNTGQTENTYFVRSIRPNAESIASVLARSTVATSSALSAGLLVSQCVTSAICISAIMSATNGRGKSGHTPPVLAGRQGSIKAARLLTHSDQIGSAKNVRFTLRCSRKCSRSGSSCCGVTFPPTQAAIRLDGFRMLSANRAALLA
jgi:hypothetical protein